MLLHSACFVGTALLLFFSCLNHSVKQDVLVPFTKVDKVIVDRSNGLHMFVIPNVKLKITQDSQIPNFHRAELGVYASLENTLQSFVFL